MPFVDVEELETAARRLSAGALQVRRCADRLVRTAAATTWRGTAADAFRSALADDVVRLRAAADALEDAAAALLTHAATVRARLAALDDLLDDAASAVLGGPP